MRTGLDIVTVISGLFLAGCGNNADLPASAGYGTNPSLPAAKEETIATLHIAPAKGWPRDTVPTAAPGLTVTPFAQQLDHPRWLTVLPNGDVLVAETNAPPQPEGGRGIKGWIQNR